MFGCSADDHTDERNAIELCTKATCLAVGIDAEAAISEGYLAAVKFERFIDPEIVIAAGINSCWILACGSFGAGIPAEFELEGSGIGRGRDIGRDFDAGGLGACYTCSENNV